MITLVIFSVVVRSLAGLAFQVARRSTRAADQALAMAAQLAGTDAASTAPYDSLSVVLTSDTVMSGGVQIVTSFVVDSISATQKNVRVIVTTSVAGSKPDTLLVQRGRIRYPIPLK